MSNNVQFETLDVLPTSERWNHPLQSKLENKFQDPIFDTSLQLSQSLNKTHQLETTFIDERLIQPTAPRSKPISPINKRFRNIIKRPPIDKFRSNTYTGNIKAKQKVLQQKKKQN